MQYCKCTQSDTVYLCLYVYPCPYVSQIQHLCVILRVEESSSCTFKSSNQCRQVNLKLMSPVCYSLLMIIFAALSWPPIDQISMWLHGTPFECLNCRRWMHLRDGEFTVSQRVWADLTPLVQYWWMQCSLLPVVITNLLKDSLITGMWHPVL